VVVLVSDLALLGHRVTAVVLMVLGLRRVVLPLRRGLLRTEEDRQDAGSQPGHQRASVGSSLQRLCEPIKLSSVH